MKNPQDLQNEINKLENEIQKFTQEKSAANIAMELLSAEMQVIDTILKTAKIALQDQNTDFLKYITSAVIEKQQNLLKRFKDLSNLANFIPNYEEEIVTLSKRYTDNLSTLSLDTLAAHLTELLKLYQTKDQDFNKLLATENNLNKEILQFQSKLEMQNIINGCINGNPKSVQEQLSKLKPTFLVKKSAIKTKLLHLACQHRQLEVVTVLLANGASPFDQDENRKSAFTLSVNDIVMHEVLLQGAIEFLSKKHLEKFSQKITENNLESSATSTPSFQESFRKQTRLFLALDNVIFAKTFFNSSEEFWTKKNFF